MMLSVRLQSTVISLQGGEMVHQQRELDTPQLPLLGLPSPPEKCFSWDPCKNVLALSTDKQTNDNDDDEDDPDSPVSIFQLESCPGVPWGEATFKWE